MTVTANGAGELQRVLAAAEEGAAGGGRGLKVDGGPAAKCNGNGVHHSHSHSHSGYSLLDPMEALAQVPRAFSEHGGVNQSLEHSATFAAAEPDALGKVQAGELGPESGHYIYSRVCNPTVYHLSRQIAALEGTESAYCTGSGMAAIAGALLELCSAGDHIVASSRLYGGTFQLLSKFLPRVGGITTTFADVRDPDAVRAAFQRKHGGTTKVLYLESMSNPTFTVADIPTLSAIAHAHGAAVVVDNSFAPLILSPARLGADVVVHSVTKFISGSADVVAGAVCGSRAFIDSVTSMRDGGALTLLGPTLDAAAAAQISLRLPHLGLRMAEHSRRALEFATRLRDQLGLKVVYPGLEQHPQHQLLRRLMNKGYGFGGILGLDMGTAERAGKLMASLRDNAYFGLMATSFGYHDTLMCRPAVTSSGHLSKKQLQESGISQGFVRVSVGYTGSLEQRWSQLLNAISDINLEEDRDES